MIPQSQRRFANVRPDSFEQREARWCAVNGWLLKGRGQGARLAEAAALKAKNARSSGGANPCNTAPPLLHSSHTSGGIDCLELTVYGTVGEVYRSTVVRLIAEKEAIQENEPLGRTTLAGGLWCQLKRTGSGVGFAHAPVFLLHGGIRLRLRERAPGQVSSQPLMFVEIPGEALLNMGERKCVQLVQQFVSYLGIQSIRISVRRVDVCADLVGALRSRFRAAYRANRFRTLGNRSSQEFKHGKTWTGFAIHGSLCSMTVYDKLTEIQNQSPHKLPAMIQYRWGGEEPPQAWRVEFRIRPGEKQRLEWRSFDDLLNGLGTICQWCCLSWFRLVDRIHKGHSERESLDSVWWDVLSAFGAWSAQYQHAFAERKKLPAQVMHLAKCAYGVLATACVIANVDPHGKSLEEILFEVAHLRPGRRPDRPDLDDEDEEWNSLRMGFEDRYAKRLIGEGDSVQMDA